MKNTNPKVSVIVPMYNAEKYLWLCVNSILIQTFGDFELILIDDCSTDATLDIAESFDDPRILILRNDKNLGFPGATRNVGIDAARGEFIYFCDDDDVMLSNALEIFITNAQRNDADIVNCTRFYMSSLEDLDNLNYSLRGIPKPAAPVSADLKTRVYQELVLQRMHVTPWLYLTRRTLFDGSIAHIRFPNEVAEDVFFAFDLICATNKIIKLDIPTYIWRAHPMSTRLNVNRLRQNLRSIIVLQKYISDKLTPLNDFQFTSKVLRYWLKHTTDSYIMPFIKSGVNLNFVQETIMSEVNSIFGDHAPFVSALFQDYLEK